MSYRTTSDWRSYGIQCYLNHFNTKIVIVLMLEFTNKLMLNVKNKYHIGVS